VGEILNHTIKREVHRGRIKGIELPGALEPQTVAQYAGDTSLTIRGEEQPVRATVMTLQSFSQASGLLINEEKSSAYYWHPGETDRPPWSRDFGWQWAESQDISKLLGAPFGLNMATADTYQFLASKIDRKLVYWCSVKLNTAGREVVVNNILISAMLYFLAIWGGSTRGVKKITAKVRNFYWSCTPTTARARVAWQVCCLKRSDGGLNLIDPNETVLALMTKWIVATCEPGMSNFKALMRFRLSHY
jgi:hypothetical protein